MSGRYRSFSAARAYVQRLKFKSVNHHWNWCIGKASDVSPKPSDIPASPHQVYKDQWVSFSDYLGTKRTANHQRQFLPFEEARKFVRSLNLGSGKEWNEYAAGRLKVAGKPARPDNIPSDPRFTYRETGWCGIKDWLGYGGPSLPQISRFRTFEAARDFARSLNLATWLEWRAYVRGGSKPADIPAIPHSAYKGKGWINYGDWLGTGLKAYHQSPFLPYSAAQKFVSDLEITNQAEWRNYCSGRLQRLAPKPANIPTNPDKAYESEWQGWQHWFHGRREG